MRTCNAEIQERSAKGSNFKEDDSGLLLLCVGGGEVARVYGAEQGYPQPRPRPVRRPGCLQQVSCTVCVMFVTLKKDYKYRRIIKGRRCCLRDIYSIPCRGRCFALG